MVIAGRWLLSGAIGVAAFVAAIAAAYVLLWAVLLAAFGPMYLLSSHWKLRVAFGALSFVIPNVGALLVLLSLAVHLSSWRRVSPWLSLGVAGVLAGIALSRLFSDITSFNCFFYGVSFDGLRAQSCDVDIR